MKIILLVFRRDIWTVVWGVVYPAPFASCSSANSRVTWGGRCSQSAPTSPSLDHLPANTWYFHVTNSPAAHNWPAKWPETTYSAASPLCGAWTASRSKLCLIDPICSPGVHMRAPPPAPPPLRRPMSTPHRHHSEPKKYRLHVCLGSAEMLLIRMDDKGCLFFGGE